MTAIVHYAPGYAAGGGPGWSPTILDPSILTDATAAVMALAYSWERKAWVVVNSEGQLYAEAANPGDLADWFMDYTAELGDMHDRGEL